MAKCNNCNDRRKLPGLITLDLTEAELLMAFESEMCPNCASADMERDDISGMDRLMCRDCLWIFTNAKGEPDAIGPESTMQKLAVDTNARDVEQRSEMQMIHDDDKNLVAEYHMMVKREGKEVADEWLKKERELRWKYPKGTSSIF